MSLITIDGQLYVDRNTYAYLLAVEAFAERGNHLAFALEDKARQLYGRITEWSEEFLVQALWIIGHDDASYGRIGDYANGTLPLQYGEILVGGKGFGVDTSEAYYPNLSPIGYGSVVGQVALEMGRRLQCAISRDKQAEKLAPLRPTIKLDTPPLGEEILKGCVKNGR